MTRANRIRGTNQQQVAETPGVPNAHYEALLRMKEHNPGARQVLSPNTKLAVQYYEAAKREHARLEEMKRESEGSARHARTRARLRGRPEQGAEAASTAQARVSAIREMISLIDAQVDQKRVALRVAQRGAGACSCKRAHNSGACAPARHAQMSSQVENACLLRCRR